MKRAIIILSLALFITLFLLWRVKAQSAPTVGVEERVSIAFLDIGQGDASYIAFPNGEDMLVDCGRDRSVLHALGRVMSRRDRRIDYLIITHPDSDHYGGCVDVLARFEVGTIVYNGMRKDGDAYWESLWSAIERERARYIVQDARRVWSIGEADVDFLFPDSDITLQPLKDDNNGSIVFSLEYNGASALFTGDAETPLEEYLTAQYGAALHSSILKVGHHGSDSSSGASFLEAVSPDKAVISSGRENKYGHPSGRVIARLERAGSRVYRTDTLGDVRLSIPKE